MSSFAVIVPCYNEADRLQAEKFIAFAEKHQELVFFFVNDGSTDTTAAILDDICRRVPRCRVISLAKNAGKGEAVRQGFLSALAGTFGFIGYLDADLSTSFEEFYRLKLFAEENDADIVLGSRIKKIDSNIKRSMSRHLIGRGIATIIDKKFNLGVYDTQCGAKIFKPAVIKLFISELFETKWFFDVEILLRIRTASPGYKAYEVPLTEWINVKDSKISLLSFPDVLKELWTLTRKY